MKIVGLDIGSTTVKAICVEDGKTLWRDYKRHNTKQAECVLEYLARMESECGLVAGRDRIFATGSGAGLIGPNLGAKLVQEVVAVAAAVEKLHPNVRFVSEIGGEDMKTVFFTPTGNGKNAVTSTTTKITIPIQPIEKVATAKKHSHKGETRHSSTVVKSRDGGTSKQVYMQSACSGGTGTFIEKTARKLEVESEQLAKMNYTDISLHKISSKCGIFAETDANTLVKSGVPVEEIIASLYEAVVYQNLASLTKGNTPLPEVLLLGGPNMFFTGLQQAWRYHLKKMWKERKIEMPDGKDPDDMILIPADALYYACMGCVEVAKDENANIAIYAGPDKLRWWIDVGQHEQKAREGGTGLIAGDVEFKAFLAKYAKPHAVSPVRDASEPAVDARTVFLGCDFGSTTAKAVVLSAQNELLFHCYANSRGNPIEDAKAVLRQIKDAGYHKIGGMAITGYGKDLLKDIIGADAGIVETVAHATAALHFFPDADVICDVGGCDVKIMLLRQGTVSDFRLNSQCSSGNGAFLQGVADRYATPLDEYAGKAFQARSIPTLAMGCGVFLQSDIVNQQRKGWSAEEIMASLAAVLPLNVWIYAGQLNNLAAAGKKFILQGGTHRNLAVVKAQVDFIQNKVPEAEIVVHPYPGEAGAIGAALCAIDWDKREGSAKPAFRGFETIEALTYKSTTNEHTTCNWCAVNCRRTFIDVDLPGARGREWSKVPLAAGWERVISGNTCPKGLLEDANEMRVVKAQLEETKRAHPNIAEMVREDGFRRARSTEEIADRDSESAEHVVYAPVLDGVPASAGH
jgi:predicted CoA-substrate-specific enzyme activase